MEDKKNWKTSILPLKKAKLNQFFSFLVCVLCVSSSFADFGSSDSSNLATLKSSVNSILNSIGVHDSGYNILESEQHIAVNAERIDKSSLRLINMLANSPNYDTFYTREHYQDHNYLTGDSSTLFNGGPINNLSMLQCLHAIAHSVGGITTNGSWISYGVTLPELILGWNTEISGKNYGVYTNGVLGRMQSIQAMMYSNEVATSNFRTNLLDKLEDVTDLLKEQVWLQTNMIFQNTPVYIGQGGVSDIRNVDDFVSFWRRERSLQVWAQSAFNSFYMVPYYLLYDENGDWDWEIQDWEGVGMAPEGSSILAKKFQETYGNFATYESAFNQANDYGRYEYEGSSNILAQTRPSRSMVTNEIPDMLNPVMGISEINSQVDEFEGIKSEYRNTTGPSQSEILKWADYFENGFVEDSQTAGFQFSITFSGVGESDVIVETQDVGLLDNVNLTRISQYGNSFIVYGVSVIKGILMLLFVWSVGEKAVGIFINTGMQAG